MRTLEAVRPAATLDGCFLQSSPVAVSNARGAHFKTKLSILSHCFDLLCLVERTGFFLLPLLLLFFLFFFCYVFFVRRTTFCESLELFF